MKKKLSVPDPCSENWSEMTPTKRGAFCDKCMINVIDFTKKSPEAILSILKENAGKKTCGHISKIQLEMVNTNFHLWKNQSVDIFRSKFLYACMLVFGLGLFTGCDYLLPEQEPDKPVGMIDVQEVGTVVYEDTTDASDDIEVMMPNDSIDANYEEEE